MALAQPPVPEHLRPHVWAKSMYQYQPFPNIPVGSIADFLQNAQTIASATPFQWNFIDCPPPGSLIFVWMSPQTFASPPTDGYQYLDPETVLHLNVGSDKTVEVYEHKYGYNPRTEGMTGYFRRRFHLIHGGNPSLWLIHYLRAPDEDRLHVSQPPHQPYPPRPYPLPTLQEIKFTLSPTGQLISFKNQNTIWPPNMPLHPQQPAPPPQAHYSLPSHPPQQPAPVAYIGGRPSGHTMYRGLPPGAPGSAGGAVPANKRIKVEEEEEEEPVMPRELAAQRFVRWTEWMEEILSSGYNIRDIVAPQGPAMNLREEDLRTRIASLESDLRTSKQRHDDLVQKFKSSCQVWKEGTKRLALAIPTTEVPRLDGIAGTAKDAESSVSAEIHLATQSSAQLEETNAQVLQDSGIPNARIRPVKKFRSVGKHIEFEPVKRVPPKPPVLSTAMAMLQKSPPMVVKEEPAEAMRDEEVVPEVDVMMREEEGMGEVLEEEEVVDGHANEAFEAMEAMDFDATADFDFDEENQVGNGDDLTMDIGVD